MELVDIPDQYKHLIEGVNLVSQRAFLRFNYKDGTYQDTEIKHINKYHMKFKKPIAFIDLETTGVSTKEDRIVEIAIVRYEFIDNKMVETAMFHSRVNPGIPIPIGASEVHGIYDRDVSHAPKFADITNKIFDMIEGCDLAGFNSNYFDFPLLFNELTRNGLFWNHHDWNFIDIGNIFKIKEPRNLANAVHFYTSTIMENAHSALHDTYATANVFFAMLEQYEDLPETSEEMELYSNYGTKRLDIGGSFVYDKDGKTILINFSDKKGQPAEDHPGFLEWMLSKSFPEDTKAIARSILYPKTEEQDTTFSDNNDHPF